MYDTNQIRFNLTRWDRKPPNGRSLAERSNNGCPQRKEINNKDEESQDDNDHPASPERLEDPPKKW